MRHEFTRQELYDLVWAEALSKLGPRLDISDVGLAKACRRADIPVPERGYWARLQAGKLVVKRPLPPRGLGMSDAVVLGENPYEPFEALRARILAEPIPPPPTFTETIEQVAERVRKQVGKVRVAKTLDRSHPLIARLLEDNARRRESLGGSSWIFPAHVPDFETPFERRRLQILNAVFLAVQRCGCRPWMRDKDARDVGIQVGERNVGFSLERIVPRRRGDAPAKANGKRLAREKMRLTITTEQGSSASGASWQDTDECRLDTVLHEAIVALIVAGEAQYRAGMHAGREWLIARKAEIEKEDRRRRSEAEQRQRERLAKLERERLERLSGRRTIGAVLQICGRSSRP